MSRKTLCFTVAAALALAVSSTASAIDTDPFRQGFAQAVYQHSPHWVHDRQPQPLLRAVVVLKVRLVGDDQLHAEVMRHNNEQPAMLQRALETVKRIRASELHPDLRSKLKHEGLIETWLFDRDGSFQVRTLAKVQRGL